VETYTDSFSPWLVVSAPWFAAVYFFWFLNLSDVVYHHISDILSRAARISKYASKRLIIKLTLPCRRMAILLPETSHRSVKTVSDRFEIVNDLISSLVLGSRDPLDRILHIRYNRWRIKGETCVGAMEPPGRKFWDIAAVFLRLPQNIWWDNDDRLGRRWSPFPNSEMNGRIIAAHCSFC